MGQTNTQISVRKFTLHSVQQMVAKVIDASISSQTGRSRNELIGIFLEYALDRCVIENDSEP